MRDTAKSQSGVVLIEALLGVLIFSIGILALVGMQASAVRNTTDARYRSEAAFLANKIIGRMWVDIPNLASYDDDSGSTNANRASWRTQVAAALPGIDLTNSILVPSIQIDGTTREVTVVIQWKQPGETETRRLEMINRISGAT
jgi:type IV pilus assembly protein PilV